MSATNNAVSLESGPVVLPTSLSYRDTGNINYSNKRRAYGNYSFPAFEKIKKGENLKKRHGDFVVETGLDGGMHQTKYVRPMLR